MKPDLGLLHLKEGYDSSSLIYFYGVEFKDIDFVSPDLFSVMYECPWDKDDQVYALSFDFDCSIMAEILARLTEEEIDCFTSSNNSSRFPFRAVLPRTVKTNVVECRLGKIQTVKKEQFVPFIIQRIE